MLNVLILGGYGFFGARIARSLAANGNVRIIVAGRDPRKAVAAARDIGLSESQGVGLDASDEELGQRFSGNDGHTACPRALAPAGNIVCSTVLFGTGLGIAFFKWSADRSNNVAAIRVVAERVVLADWIFTTPAIVVQAASGLLLARMAGFSLTSDWLLAAIALYLVAGACWLPVVWLQIRMRALAREADRTGALLDPLYWRYSRAWFWLGVPAFLALIVVFALMVLKPFAL